MRICTKCGAAKPTSEYYYSTGKRTSLRGDCKSCARQRQRELRNRNPAAYRARNLEQYYRKKAENPDWLRLMKRRDSLRTQYGLSLEAVDAMASAQGGGCAMCREPFVRTPHVDHDHACCPGKKSCGACVRGLLCGPCNAGLGWYEKYGAKAADYLGRAHHASA